MKKTKIFSIVFAVGFLSLVATGCGGKPGVDAETHTAKSTDLIKFNIKDAKYLATQWADKTDETKARAAYARKIAREAGDETDEEEKVEDPLKSLVAVVEGEDGELKEETVMEVPAEELQLCDWCVPQPVREIYQCPYDQAEAKAKGVYTVFACYIDWWKYTDDTPAPGISMLMYTKPDGSSYDVLNINGNVKYFLTTWQKENEGEDYIQFDENGNLFALAKDDTKEEYAIFRYNPLSDEVTDYRLTGIKGEVYIRNFKVTKDGKWIFLNVMVDNMKNNVYAIKVNSTDAPITMYEYKGTEKAKEPSWAVSSIGINPTNQNVYWYVDDYNDFGRPNAGLYVAEKQTAGYSKANVKYYHTLQWWQILDFVKVNLFDVDPSNIEQFRAFDGYSAVVAADANKDYKKLLDYLKGVCGYTGEVEFNFSKFKDLTGMACKDWDGKAYETDDFAKLGESTLTDEAALKYLFTTSYEDALELPDDQKSDWTKRNLFSNFIERFYNECWKFGELYKKEGYSILADSDSNEVSFPLGYFMFKKGTTESAYFLDDNKDNYDNAQAYIKSEFGAKMNGIILANDEGTWVFSDIWDENKVKADGTKGNNSHSAGFRLTDNKGNFKCNQPGDLATLKFKPRWDADFAERDETDPWYQSPVKANSKGIAAISADYKTIYYHSGDTTIDLLASDPNKSKIATIYAFTLQEDQLIYNAVKAGNGGYLMVSIDLKEGTATKLPLKNKVESMLGL